MSDSDNPSNPPIPAVLVENTDTEGQGDQSDVNASNTESNLVNGSRPRLKRSYSKNLNSPSDGRKFHTIHSSDGAKFFNLENQLRELQGTNKGDANNTGSERQLTVETAVYRDQPMFSESRRPLLVRSNMGNASLWKSTRAHEYMALSFFFSLIYYSQLKCGVYAQELNQLDQPNERNVLVLILLLLLLRYLHRI